MPLDSLMWSDNDFKRRCIGWSLTRSFIPRRCYYTGKYLWFKKAYLGTAVLTGPGDPIIEHRWCIKDQYLFLKIKGIL
jgi:hypothetical protein